MSTQEQTGARVGIVMGSDSDWPVMQAAGEILTELGVAWEADVVSAHRMPTEMIAWGQQAHTRGLSVVIAGAGGAAHLPGMLAAVTPLPVIGVPVPLTHLDIPVAAVAIGNAKNAGILAARILGTSDAELQQRLVDYQSSLAETAHAKGAVVRDAAAGVDRRLGF